MKINVKAVLQREAERISEVKPLPKIVIRKPDTIIRKGTESKLEQSVKPHTDKVIKRELSEKETLLAQLWEDFKSEKKMRAKLSSKTPLLVEDVVKKLRKEGGAVVKAFLNGEIPIPSLKEHYEAIQAHTEILKTLYDKIRYVEQHGVLPKLIPLVTTVDNADGKDAKALYYEIRRLDDLIYKNTKKMEKAKAGLKVPKNSSRNEMWHLKIELAMAQRESLKQTLKRVQYESREQRIAAE